VRLSLGIFSFIKTPLFKGETRQSAFLTPLLHVDSVGEALADILRSGYGKTIYMPGAMRYVAMLVSCPVCGCCVWLGVWVRTVADLGGGISERSARVDHAGGEREYSVPRGGFQREAEGGREDGEVEVRSDKGLVVTRAGRQP
jgi:hypothetical protein